MIKYEVIIYWSAEDEAFIAEVPELPGCAAHGDSQGAALSNAQDAIRLWIDTAKEFGDAGGFVEDEQMGGEAADGVGGGGQGDDVARIGEADGEGHGWDGFEGEAEDFEEGLEAAQEGEGLAFGGCGGEGGGLGWKRAKWMALAAMTGVLPHWRVQLVRR